MRRTSSSGRVLDSAHRVLLACPLLIFSTQLLCSCGGADDEHPSRPQLTSEGPIADAGPEPAPVSDLATGSCVEGSAKGCRIVFGNHDGIVDCFVGVQVCANGIWGSCQKPAE